MTKIITLIMCNLWRKKMRKSLKKLLTFIFFVIIINLVMVELNSSEVNFILWLPTSAHLNGNRSIVNL